MNNPIRVVFCIDKTYMQHLATALASLFTHNNANELKVFIVSSALDEIDVDRLSTLAKTFGSDLIFTRVDDSRAAGFREILHFSRAAYYRLLLPELLPNEEKVIYLDCDLVVEANLKEFWDTPVSSHGCAGVGAKIDAVNKRLGIELDFCVNSGVLLLNLEYWRIHNITKNCLDWLDENEKIALMPDNDAINIILHKQMVSVDEKWNFNPSAIINGAEVLNRYTSRIIHFAGAIKPWHKCYDFGLQKIYLKYLSLTPWFKDFFLREPINVGQSCLVANQLYQQNDFMAACRYYQLALNFRIKSKAIESKLVLDSINGGHRHFNNQDYVSACEHYRSCIENWGYQITYDSVYRMPGIFDGM